MNDRSNQVTTGPTFTLGANDAGKILKNCEQCSLNYTYT